LSCKLAHWLVATHVLGDVYASFVFSALFIFSSYEHLQDRPMNGRTGKTHNAVYLVA